MPSVYALPHVQQAPVAISAVAFVPQWPQKGIDASTGFAHFGQAFVLANGDTRPDDMSPPDPTAAPGIGDSGGDDLTAAGEPPTEKAGTMRAADAEIGFPQSMQKRDIGSLSRPQKAQETRGVTV